VDAFKMMGATYGNMKKVVAGSNGALMILQDGTVWATGWHDYIFPGAYNVSTTWTQLPVGTAADAAYPMDHAILDQGNSGAVAGWGGNLNGKLGDGTNIERHTLTQAVYTALPSSVVVPAVVTTKPTVPTTTSPGKKDDDKNKGKDDKNKKDDDKNKKDDDKYCKDLSSSITNIFKKLSDDDAYRCGQHTYSKASECRKAHKDDGKYLNVNEYCKKISDKDD
jgi:alpha-tubulin suppressor-like RCC1 family protein